MTATDVRAVLLEAEADRARRFHLYRVAADAATDAGDDALAAGLRWLAERKGRPQSCGGAWAGLWGWYVPIRRAPAVLGCALPPAVARHLADGVPAKPYPVDHLGRRDWFHYHTFPDAVVAAARAAGKELLP